MDSVPFSRATIRVVFHPESLPATQSTTALRYLRDCLERAEKFYAAHDDAVTAGRVQEWRGVEGAKLREDYKKLRGDIYLLLDQFAAEVAARLVKPSWDPNTPTKKWAATAASRAADGSQVTESPHPEATQHGSSGTASGSSGPAGAGST